MYSLSCSYIELSSDTLCKKIKGASEFFALIQTLYVFVSTTKAHIIFMKKQSEVYLDSYSVFLIPAGRDAICFKYDAVILTLQDIANGSDHFKAVEAKGLLH